MRILVIEDHQDIAANLGDFLEDRGHTVDFAADGITGEATATPAGREIWRSYASLADADARWAFFRTLHAVIDPRGQAVGAADRLYLAVAMPTLIVWGARDPFIPVRHAHAAHAAIPGSRLEIFDDVGHYPHCEAPARFQQVLLEFIDSTSPARVSERQWRTLFHPPREGV